METVVALRSEALAKGEALKVAEAEKGRLAADAAALRDQIATKRGEADKCGSRAQNMFFVVVLSQLQHLPGKWPAHRRVELPASENPEPN